MDREEAMKIRKLVKEQEAAIKVDRFTNNDAFDLGCFFKKEIEEKGIDFVISIRRPNGNIIFQWASPNSALSHETWAGLKFNLTAMTGNCSIDMALMGATPEAFNLDGLKYAFSGGAFPIKTKDDVLIAVVCGSGLPHTKDHAFIANTLAKYYDVEIPAYEG